MTPSLFYLCPSFDKMQSTFYSPRSFTALVNSTSMRSIPYRPREVSLRFDGAIAATWLQACKEHHTTISCDSSSMSALDVVSIDCKTREVCQSRTPMAYAALSYVWGSVKPAPPTQGLMPSNVSAVTAGAMKITLALGLRCVWVGQYCIDQDDAVIKAQNL